MRIGFTEPWIPGPFDLYDPGEAPTTYETTVIFGMDGDTALERFLGCLMIQRMPDAGLQEALTSLYAMLEFYSEAPLLLKQPQPERVQGVVVGERKRPDLVIAE
ncbi:MAG: hypothetical protein HYX92_17445 [Chloroflexi bacterium]|nr:hypothetical protein [Chloroflexota bacterium]